MIPKTSDSNSWFKQNFPNLFILIVLIFITYGNALNNAFVSDDIAEIVQNPNLGNLSNIFTTHPFGFIRPLLYWVAFQIGGLNPIFFRMINIFFHIGSVLLVYGLISKIYSKRLAFWIAAIFAVNPAISEAVVWISGGAYPQYSFFFLLSILLYILSFNKNSKVYYWTSVLVFLFAFMSHPQMPLGLFLIFPLYEFVFGNLKKNWIKVIPFITLSIIYIFISLGALPERETTLQSIHYQEQGIDNPFVLIPVAVTSYLQLIFWPKDLTLYHSELVFGQFEFLIRAAVSVLIFLGLIISFKTNRTIFFWGCFFLISLAPTLTPFRLNWVVAERYLYLPSLGIFVLFCLGLNKLFGLRQFRWAAYSILTIAIILLSTRTIIRNIDWKNEDNLWIATGKTSPSSPNTHNNLGDVYGRLGDKERSLQEFQTAISLKPDYADAYHNAGNVYRELGQLDKALEYYQKAASLSPILWQSYQNIAAIYFQEKQYDKAQEFMQKAIQINPKNINLRVNLGIVYLGSGDKEKAKEIFNLVLSVDPQNQIAKQGFVEATK